MYSAASLTSLNLGNNKFSSAISEKISNLLSLKELFLWFNQLTGLIPTSMGDLENLGTLNLCNKQRKPLLLDLPRVLTHHFFFIP